MPNWMMNDVTLTGSKEDIANFIAFAKQDGRKELDFDLFVPMPKSLEIDAPTEMKDLAVGEFLIDHTLTMMGKQEKYSCYTAKKYMTDYVERILHSSEEDDEKLVKQYIKAKKLFLDAEDFEHYIQTCRKAYRNFKIYGYANWYEFRMDKWGTKWNPSAATSLDAFIPKYDGLSGTWSVRFTFQTAWDTPDGIFEAISKRFPKLKGTVDFAEEEYGYATGSIEFFNGKLSKYNCADESMEAFEHSLAVWNQEELLDCLKKGDDGKYYIDYNDM